MTIYYVYIHRTQDTNEVFYIGKGTARRRFHSRARSLHWTNKVKKHGGFYSEILIDNIEDEFSAFEWEKYFIYFYRMIGWKLVNGTDGGDAGPNQRGRIVTIESRKKMSKSQKGKKKSAEFCIKTSLRQIGPKNHCYGKKHSEEHKRKIGEKSKGNKYRLGIPDSQETKDLKSKLMLLRPKILCTHCNKLFNTGLFTIHKNKYHL